MSWTKNVIVVANQTATSDELVAALKERAERESTRFLLIVPGTPHDDARVPSDQRLAEALDHMREAGLEVHGFVGDPDPVVAVSETWNPKDHDEIIVSTLPLTSSKWLHAGLPDRIAKVTDATVTHVIANPVRHTYATVTAPPQEHKSSILDPLSATWHRDDR